MPNEMKANRIYILMGKKYFISFSAKSVSGLRFNTSVNISGHGLSLDAVRLSKMTCFTKFAACIAQTQCNVTPAPPLITGNNYRNFEISLLTTTNKIFHIPVHL